MKDKKRYLVTGGAGFIGSNAAAYLLDRGHEVTVLDNLSRVGVEKNLENLASRWPKALAVVKGDIRRPDDVRRSLADVDVVIHCAAQVGMVQSLADPRLDFELNAFGTVTLLEEIRRSEKRTPVLFTSSNKVYGALSEWPIREGETRYTFDGSTIAVNESAPLDPDNPYACSKVAAETYLQLYRRLYDIPYVIFRMSCIWGPGQFGHEDQGWMAHLLGALVRGRPVNVFGDGKQVRDVLYVTDLLEAMAKVLDAPEGLSNAIYNIGGGQTHTLSILEYLELCERLTGKKFDIRYKPWRYSDQKVFVSDTGKFGAATDWQPQVSIDEGMRHLLAWAERNFA